MSGVANPTIMRKRCSVEHHFQHPASPVMTDKSEDAEMLELTMKPLQVSVRRGKGRAGEAGASYDPRDAEILPGQTPKWHLLEVHEQRKPTLLRSSSTQVRIRSKIRNHHRPRAESDGSFRLHLRVRMGHRHWDRIAHLGGRSCRHSPRFGYQRRLCRKTRCARHAGCVPIRSRSTTT